MYGMFFSFPSNTAKIGLKSIIVFADNLHFYNINFILPSKKCSRRPKEKAASWSNYGLSPTRAEIQSKDSLY